MLCAGANGSRCLSADCSCAFSAWWSQSRGAAGAGEHPPQEEGAAAGHTGEATHLEGWGWQKQIQIIFWGYLKA